MNSSVAACETSATRYAPLARYANSKVSAGRSFQTSDNARRLGRHDFGAHPLLLSSRTTVASQRSPSMPKRGGCAGGPGSENAAVGDARHTMHAWGCAAGLPSSVTLHASPMPRTSLLVHWAHGYTGGRVLAELVANAGRRRGMAPAQRAVDQRRWTDGVMTEDCSNLLSTCGSSSGPPCRPLGRPARDHAMVSHGQVTRGRRGGHC